jgi:hypothetical protein
MMLNASMRSVVLRPLNKVNLSFLHYLLFCVCFSPFFSKKKNLWRRSIIVRTANDRRNPLDCSTQSVETIDHCENSVRSSIPLELC